MSNLLPPQQKKRLRREYVIRLVIVSVFVLAVVVSIAAAFLFPAYILTSVNEEVARQNLATEEAVLAKNSVEDLTALVGDINKRLTIFSDTPERSPVSSKVLAPILAARPSGVKITGLNYTNEYIVINGFASRSTVITYVDRLKKVPEFASVEIPISSFVRDRNLNFTITIKQNETAQ